MTAVTNMYEKTMDVDITNPYESSVDNLTRGLTLLYKAPLVNVEKQLKELTTKQDYLITQIHNENLRLSEVQYSPEIQDTFVKLKSYHNKLLNLKRDMKCIYERSIKLKKRALRLQQIKEHRLQTELNPKNADNLTNQPSGSG